MTFSEQVCAYMDLLDCTVRELAEASGLGAGTISRYRSGESAPSARSEKLDALICGFDRLARERSVPLAKEDISDALTSCVDDSLAIDYPQFVSNLVRLLEELEISNSRFSHALRYDPSHMSRILSGKRRPPDLRSFSARAAAFVADSVFQNASPTDRNETIAREVSAKADRLAALFGCDVKEISSRAALYQLTMSWLGSHDGDLPRGPISGFLEKLDEFNLDDFIQAIHFDDIKLPTVPFSLPTTKTYRGIKSFQEAEIDFMRAAVLSKSMDDLILYSDMPITEMAENEDFARKYMFGMAMLIKKGLHIHFIHDVHRPFHEMLLGLEGNIPLYMTGQISPYYLPHPVNEVFCHSLKISGTVVLAGEAMAGDYKNGRYLVSKNREEVNYQKRRAEKLLHRAKPLMDIYRSDRRKEFSEALREKELSGDRKMVLPGLPFFTLSEELLLGILSRSAASSSETADILEFARKRRELLETISGEYSITLEVPSLTLEQFKSRPQTLLLPELFCERDYPLTYEEYCAHLALTREFAAAHPGCRLTEIDNPAFCNISFSLFEDCVVVSKSKSPVIHFIIRHPSLVKAFANFVPPVNI